VGPATEKARRP